MSNEEKEALEILKLYFGEEPTLNITKYVNIVLNLIEKQSKEIEKLKTNNGYHIGFIDGGIAKRYEYEDKIKAKMKEKEWSLENYDCNESDYKQSQAIGAWSVLQSLLEKE